jgi:hypothetical protein
MGLNYAIEELYASGWSALDSTGCGIAPDGRIYPGIERVQRDFTASGFLLTLSRIDLFDCYRAEWRTPAGDAVGAVVGQTQEEAAVYALAQMRRTASSQPA